MADPACYWHRDASGFCQLQNRCWAGKPCPKTQRQADAARAGLIDAIAADLDFRKERQP